MPGDFNVIDRRKNPKSKSLSNRQRFIDRAKESIREAAKKSLGDKSIKDYDSGETVINIPSDGITEPKFRHDSDTGNYDYVLPGNEDLMPGDTIGKKKDGGGGSRGTKGAEEAEGEDTFEFVLTTEEFLNIIFDDLELPDLIKRSEKQLQTSSPRRAGHNNQGNPSNLNIEKTALAGLGRRIALRTPNARKIKELEELLLTIDAEDVEKREEIVNQINNLKRKIATVSYLDNVDMRYNNFVPQLKPQTHAVMFCMMDVSFSMGEREKIIAKKFFILLHLFLKRRYENIDVVFVRHHDKAIECDEDTFFKSKEGGGTVVSSGYSLIKSIIADRYDISSWNIYIAQASDGDNYDHDNIKVEKFLTQDLLPVCQYFNYVEIARQMPLEFSGGWPVMQHSNLWDTIHPLSQNFSNVSCVSIEDEKDVIAAFRKLFVQHKENT